MIAFGCGYVCDEERLNVADYVKILIRTQPEKDRWNRGVPYTKDDVGIRQGLWT